MRNQTELHWYCYNNTFVALKWYPFDWLNFYIYSDGLDPTALGAWAHTMKVIIIQPMIQFICCAMVYPSSLYHLLFHLHITYRNLRILQMKNL